MKLQAITLFAFSFTAGAQDLFDQYGGAKSLPCPAGAKPLFYTEKIADRWWFCTPKGNAFFLHSLWNVPAPPINSRAWAKIGGDVSSSSSQSWYPVLTRRLSKWGFNSYDSYTSRYGAPTANPQFQLGHKTAFPIIMGEALRPSFYGLYNRGNLRPQPLKSFDTPLVWTNASRTEAWRFQDIFDSNYREYFLAMLNSTSDNAYNHVFTSTAAKRAWVLGWSVDDTDWLAGIGAGPDFLTGSDGSLITGRRHQHLSIGALYTAPAIGVLSRSPASGSGMLYANPRTTTITCNGAEEAGSRGLPGYAAGPMSRTTMPSDTVCTKYALRRFLEARYGTIEALNAAWNSSYTTFDSSGIPVADQLVATTNGTDTLAFTVPDITGSNQISPFSVRVFKNGVYIGADARHLDNIVIPCNNGSASALSFGQIFGETLRGSVTSGPCSNPVTTVLSTINYTTGAVVLKFDSAPAPGEEIRLDYVIEGWGRGTGLMDERGKSPWLLNVESTTASPLLVSVDVDIKNDLDEFLYRYAYRYFKDIRDTLDSQYTPLTGCDRSVNGGKGICPIYTGPSYIGTWSNPGFAPIVRAASELLDVYPYYTWPEWTPDYQARLDFMYTHWGDKPIIAWEAFTGGNDSPFPVDAGAQVRPRNNTQAARGLQYKSLVSAMQRFKFPNGSYPAIGVRYWDLNGSTGERMNWGIFSPNDDPLDGYCPGPGTRSEMIPGGATLASVTVSGTSGTITTTTFHNMSIGVQVRFSGCTLDSDLCAKDWPVTAIASGNATITLDGSVSNGTYNESDLKLEYVRYPCGGSNAVCMQCTLGSEGNRYLNTDPRFATDTDGPWNNTFGDFLSHVREANGYWLDLINRSRVSLGN